MELLTWLTVIYLVVLVTTLAIGLILILLVLRSIGGKLAKIGGGLKQVESNTAPLNAGVEALNDGLGGLAGGLQIAEASFASANEHLQKTLDGVTMVKR
jgi:hypothetical protein